MNSYMFDIGDKTRKVSRFIGEVRAQLQTAFIAEKNTRKLTQQQLATMIGTDRAVINRQLMGYENLTLRRVAELAWALGWEIYFELRRPQSATGYVNVAKSVSSAQSAQVINLVDERRKNTRSEAQPAEYKSNVEAVEVRWAAAR